MLFKITSGEVSVICPYNDVRKMSGSKCSNEKG